MLECVNIPQQASRKLMTSKSGGYASPHLRAAAVRDIDNAMALIGRNQGALEPHHRTLASRVFKMDQLSGSGPGAREGSGTPYTINDIHEQYRMVQRLRDQLLDRDDRVLVGVSAKDLSSLINSINSLIGLFLRAEEVMNRVEEEGRLREAVQAALTTLPAAARKTFFNRLSDLETQSKYG
jgi:tRNA threonylcarbamoyladenosine modification (KEOPS) complex  Pcc1 subunit